MNMITENIHIGITVKVNSCKKSLPNETVKVNNRVNVIKISNLWRWKMLRFYHPQN